MKIHEFGDKNKPVLLLLPGTMCYWKGNFGHVIDTLSKDLFMSVVTYTGFDESDTESYSTTMDEVKKIEQYILEHYNGSILAAYGSSLGGSFVAHLVARHKIHMKYGIIGSSDMDQAGQLKASLLANLMIKITYNFIHTGKYKSRFMQKRFHKQMASVDPYNKAFVAMVGRDKYDMSFITKQSLIHQFKTDLVTKFPKQIDNGETVVHVFYAKKMKEKYLERYHTYFKNPIIHTQDLSMKNY